METFELHLQSNGAFLSLVERAFQGAAIELGVLALSWSGLLIGLSELGSCDIESGVL